MKNGNLKKKDLQVKTNSSQYTAIFNELEKNKSITFVNKIMIMYKFMLN